MDKIVEFCDKLDDRMVNAIAKKATDKVKDMKSKTSLPANVKNDWKKFLGKCNADPKFFDGVVDAAEVRTYILYIFFIGFNVPFSTFQVMSGRCLPV